MTISRDFTFVPDYGRQMQTEKRKRRSKKVTKPVKREATGIELIMSRAGAEEAIKRLEERQQRAILEHKAKEEWARLSPLRRAFLSLFGFDAVSYAETK